MGIHWQELIVILLIVLILFGPRKLPEIGSSLGRGIRGFRESLNGNESTSNATTDTKQAVKVPVEATPLEIVEPHDQTEQKPGEH